MKVALVYDRVNKFGGAERVLLNLKKIFPDAPLYTLVHDKNGAGWSELFEVRPTFMNKLSFFRKRHELLAPVAVMAFESLNLDGFDLIISVTSADAKSVITKPNQVHICLCLTPTRYFWSGSDEYKNDPKMRFLPQILVDFFRQLDLQTSNRPDLYLAISNEVKTRLKNYYKKDAEVVYPPIDDFFYTNNPIPKSERSYYLVVSRLVKYKKVHLAIRALNALNLPLLVIGEGDQKESLQKIAGSKTVFLGAVSDYRLKKYYQYAKATIFPQNEDFGLVPIESQACGTPVIAYRAGGALETIVEGKTGVFFQHQNTKSLVRAIKNFEKLNIDYMACIENAKNFSEEKFRTEFLKQVKEATGLHY